MLLQAIGGVLPACLIEVLLLLLRHDLHLRDLPSQHALIRIFTHAICPKMQIARKVAQYVTNDFGDNVHPLYPHIVFFGQVVTSFAKVFVEDVLRKLILHF